MIFDFRKSNEKHETIIINNEEVERVKTYKYLGVVFDEKLDWFEQSNKVVCKMKSRLYFMRKLHSIELDRSLLILFYKSCFLSIVNYCLMGWGGNWKYQQIWKR